MRIFIGWDKRQPVAAAVLASSIQRRASKPVQITNLVIDQMPIPRRGLTEFTYSRFLVPWLCNYQGKALFMDADMLVLSDICELFDLFEENHAVQVVKNKQHFEWPSLMLFNNAACRQLTPEFVETSNDLFKMEWGDVGELPAKWNYCVGYDEKLPWANVVHFTKGIPVWDETVGCPYSEHWHKERRFMMSTCSFNELMGKSVHVA